MSKYGPAWVWLATGQSLRQVTPSSALHRRSCQPQSAPSIHVTLAILSNSVIGNWSRGGWHVSLAWTKERDSKCFGDLLNQGFASKQWSGLPYGRWE